jgi:NADH-quinone oxidoreductase subunit N
MNMAAFLIVDEIEEQSGKLLIDDYKGLGKVNAPLMAAFVIVLVSLTGLPPTVGFTAKFLVFSSAIEAFRSTNSIIILIMIIIAAVSTVVSLFYYFKIPLNAFLRDSGNQIVKLENSPKAYIGLFLAILLLVLIVFPSVIADLV